MTLLFTVWLNNEFIQSSKKDYPHKHRLQMYDHPLVHIFESPSFIIAKDNPTSNGVKQHNNNKTSSAQTS